ncbi:PE family protein, partial [Mycobacterium szulgai]|uniref:PE family protein n=1 Tax=Mycobacterium szulgai TaxID=1787 RepID=UPI0021F2B472
MSYLVATPQILSTAVGDLTHLGSVIASANIAAAGTTNSVAAAAADDVSVAIAALFSRHSQTWQAVAAEAAMFHDQLVQTMTASAGAYASAEAVNVQQILLDAINAPTEAALGRPLIGNGANAAPGSGAAGGAAGILIGNGGNGGL